MYKLTFKNDTLTYDIKHICDVRANIVIAKRQYGLILDKVLQEGCDVTWYALEQFSDEIRKEMAA